MKTFFSNLLKCTRYHLWKRFRTHGKSLTLKVLFSHFCVIITNIIVISHDYNKIKMDIN